MHYVITGFAEGFVQGVVITLCTICFRYTFKKKAS